MPIFINPNVQATMVQIERINALSDTPEANPEALANLLAHLAWQISYYEAIDKFVATHHCNLIITQQNLQVKRYALAFWLSDPRLNHAGKLASLLGFGRDILLISSLLWLQLQSEHDTQEVVQVVYANCDRIINKLMTIDINNIDAVPGSFKTFIDAAIDATEHQLVQYCEHHGVRLANDPVILENARHFAAMGRHDLAAIYASLLDVGEISTRAQPLSEPQSQPLSEPQAQPQPGPPAQPQPDPIARPVSAPAELQLQVPRKNQKLLRAIRQVPHLFKTLMIRQDAINKLLQRIMLPVNDSIDTALVEHLPAESIYISTSISAADIIAGLPPPPPPSLATRIRNAVYELNAAAFNELQMQGEQTNQGLYDTLEGYFRTLKDKDVEKNKKILTFVNKIQLPIRECVLLFVHENIHNCIKISLLGKIAVFNIATFGPYNAAFNICGRITDSLDYDSNNSSNTERAIITKSKACANSGWHTGAQVNAAIKYFLKDPIVFRKAISSYLEGLDPRNVQHTADADRRNFYHVLLSDLDVATARKVLGIFADLDKKNLLAFGLLEADSAGVTPLMQVEDKGEEWDPVRIHFIYKVRELFKQACREDITDVSNRFARFADIYDHRHPQGNYVVRLFLQDKLPRMVAILKDRYDLRYALKSMACDVILESRKLDTVRKSDLAMEIGERVRVMFGFSEYCLQIGGKEDGYLIDVVLDKWLKSPIPLDPTLYPVFTAEEFKLAIRDMPIVDTVLWSHLKERIQDPATTEEQLIANLQQFKALVDLWQIDINAAHEGSQSIMSGVVATYNVVAIQYFHVKLNAKLDEASLERALLAHEAGRVDVFDLVARAYYAEDQPLDLLYTLAAVLDCVEALEYLETLAVEFGRKPKIHLDTFLAIIQYTGTDNCAALGHVLDRYTQARIQDPLLPELDDMADPAGEGLLYYAAIKVRSAQKFCRLVRHGFKVDGVYHQQRATLPMIMLHFCKNGDLDLKSACTMIAECLAHIHTRHSLVSAKDKDGVGILEYLVDVSDVAQKNPADSVRLRDIINALVEAGAPLDAVSITKKNILHTAAFCITHDTFAAFLIDILINHLGAEAVKKMVRANDTMGHNALDYAFYRYCALNTSPDIVALLLSLDGEFNHARILLTIDTSFVLFSVDGKTVEITAQEARAKLQACMAPVSDSTSEPKPGSASARLTAV